MHRLRRNTVLAAGATAVAAIAATLVWTWPRPMVVETARVDRGDVVVSVVDLGETRLREPYRITAPVGGQLRRIDLEPGDAVGEGDVLAWIDPARSTPIDARQRASLEASLRQARATERGAREEADRARDEARRIAALRAAQLVSVQADRDARSREVTARAALEQAEAAVARIAAELNDPRRDGHAIAVRSPVDGVVVARGDESGRPVLAGEGLMEVGDPRALDVVAEFLSQDAVSIRPGARAWIEGWGGAATPAVVRKISPGGRRKVSALGVEEQRVDVWLDPEAPLPGVGTGYQVEARVETNAARGVLRIPVESVQRDGEGWAVWAIVDGRLRRQPVTVGLSDGRWREITAGLGEGDRIVRRPDATLVEGRRVL